MLFWLILVAAGVLEDGVRLSNQGQWAEAREKFAEAVRQQPRNAMAWKALGVAAGKVGLAADSEEAFRRSCELDRKLADACYYHARSLYVLNRFEEALAALKVVAAADPKQGRRLVATGQALEALGREREAEAAFVEALKKDDALDEARLRMGVFLFRAGRLADAERMLVEAVKKRDGFGEAMGELGRVYYQQGQLKLAVGTLEKASALRPDLEWIPLLLERARRRQ